MKAKEIRQLQVIDLEAKLEELRSELVKIRNQVSRGITIKQPAKCGMLKRSIAQVMTIIREKETSKTEVSVGAKNVEQGKAGRRVNQ